jgi:hypothetical protein
LVVLPGTWQENRVHTICHSRCRRFVDGRAQHTWRTLVQLCKYIENLVSSSLPAFRDTTETRLEPCITCTCTNLSPQNMGRKSNVCAHSNWGVPITKVSTLVDNAPWCGVRKSVFYPPIELYGHRGTVWRVIKCEPLVPRGYVYDMIYHTPACMITRFHNQYFFC